MRRCVIFNPVARGEKAKKFQAELVRWSSQCALKPTASAGNARALAAEAVREKFDVIIAAGGDGTLNEVLNGIGDADGFARVALGVLPLGTVNVFAKEIGVPSRLQAAWRIIDNNYRKEIDLPWAEFSAPGGRERRFFAQLAGAGFDARAVELVDWELKKKLGPLAYVIAGCRALKEFKPRIHVTGDDWTAEGEMVLVGNGGYYGGRYRLFPRADLTDGRIDVTVFPKINWRMAAQAGAGLLIAQMLRSTGAQTFQTRQLTLASGAPVSLQLDGEWVGHLPAAIGVGGAKLRVVAPTKGV